MDYRSQAMETMNGEADDRWWARQLWKLPVWAWIVIAVLVLAVVGSAVRGDDEDETAAATSAPSATATSELSTTTTPPTTKPVEATSDGLRETPAQVACDRHGEDAFPYGYEPHWLMGVMLDEIRDDQWVFKINVTVTNEHDAEQEITVECVVEGTEDAPVVADFVAY